MTAGVSYFKILDPREIVLGETSREIDWEAYIDGLYGEGLREFRFVNDLPLNRQPSVYLETERPSLPLNNSESNGALIPMGGGRDSLLVAFALQSLKPVLMTVGQNPIVKEQARSLGLTLHQVRRRIDPLLLDLNKLGALNGHVPVTAINSCIGIAVAKMMGKTDLVMSNESSASTATRTIEGIEINHQYSKSWNFEKLLNETIESLKIPVRYFSILRELDEVQISQRLAKHWDSLPRFVSCNRVSQHWEPSRQPEWCRKCAKCYFVFVALAPWISRHKLTTYFGRDLLATESDVRAIEALLLDDSRAFECIGTVDEVRRSLHSASTLEWRDSLALLELSRRFPPSNLEAVERAEKRKETNIPTEYLRLLEAL